MVVGVTMVGEVEEINPVLNCNNKTSNRTDNEFIFGVGDMATRAIRMYEGKLLEKEDMLSFSC